jgi:hypothetical protein
MRALAIVKILIYANPFGMLELELVPARRLRHWQVTSVPPLEAECCPHKDDVAFLWNFGYPPLVVK